MENKAVPALTQTVQVAAIRTKPAIAAARVPKDSGDILGTTGRYTFPSCPMQRGQPEQDLKEPLSWYPGIDPRALCRWQLAQLWEPRYHTAPQPSLKGSN